MKKSALVLSGWGALWVAHLGVLTALEHTWYMFDWYAGVSAWAIIASGMALGYSPEKLKDIIFETKLLNLAFDFSWKKWWLLSWSKVRNVLEEIFWSRTFQDTHYPLFISTTNYETGERLTITQWKIIDAIEASLSIPLIFTPFYHPVYQCYCVDGWLSHNFPVDLATQNYKGDHIVWIDVNTSLSDLIVEEGQIQELSVSENIQRVFKIFFRNQLLPKDPRVTIVRPNLSEYASFDIFHLQEIWRVGYESIISPEKQPWM